MISLRSRKITLRQLDPERIESDRVSLQISNVGLPILISIILGGSVFAMRRRRYAQAA